MGDSNKSTNEIIRANEYMNCNEIILSEEYRDIIIEYRKSLENSILLFKPKCIQIINDQYAIFHLPLEQDLPEVTVEITGTPSLLGNYAKSSLDSSGILNFHTQPYVPLRGEGVLIGIVDSGIDYTNRVFTYEDNTTKITSIWDQTVQGNPPDGFLYGTEYSMEEINRALKAEEPYKIVPSEDVTGHGTFLAGIAAGREIVEEDFIGAAPDAELVIVKLKQAKEYLKNTFFIRKDEIVYQSTDIMLGVKYLYEKATALGRPLVIIIGLGTNQTGHDGTSFIEDYLDSIARRTGVVIVVAAGNEANLGHHYRGQFTLNETYKNVEINVAKDEEGFVFSTWGNAPDKISMGITSPTGEYIERISPRIFQEQNIELILEKTKIRVLYQLADIRTGDEAIFVVLENPTEGIWTFTVFGDLIVNGRFDMWLPREGWNKKETRFLQPNVYTTITVPGTSTNLLTVGAYNHRTNSLYLNSSRGLTRVNKLKPEIVAPGVDISGPLSGNKFGTMTGTSISAAIAGGASALLLEWGIVLGNDTNIDTQKATNYFIRGATRRDELEYPNREWGFGELNLLGTYETLRGT